MIAKALKILDKKQLLIIGKTKNERARFVTKIIEPTFYETYRFPTGMNTIDEYLTFVRKHNLYDPWYTKKGNFSFAQIMDFHWDWIQENHVLIVMEELDEMEERWKLDLLRTYLEVVENRQKNQKLIHLLFTQESENGLVNKLAEIIRSDNPSNRTNRQIVEGSLKILELF